MVSINDNPMSSLYPIVLALRNEIVKVLKDDNFEQVLGAGAVEKVISVLRVRFNLDGSLPKPPQKKVGILDEYQI